MTFAGRDSLTAGRMHQTCQTVETIVGICDLCWGHGRVGSLPLNDRVCLLFTDPPCRLHTFYFLLWNAAVKSVNIPSVPWNAKPNPNLVKPVPSQNQTTSPLSTLPPKTLMNESTDIREAKKGAGL